MYTSFLEQGWQPYPVDIPSLLEVTDTYTVIPYRVYVSLWSSLSGDGMVANTARGELNRENRIIIFRIPVRAC